MPHIYREREKERQALQSVLLIQAFWITATFLCFDEGVQVAFSKKTSENDVRLVVYLGDFFLLLAVSIKFGTFT